MNTPQKVTDFDEVLLRAIDDALATLGDKAKSSIYLYLLAKYALPKVEIPDRIVDFADALERILGQGALHLEILIMKYINERVQGAYQYSGPSWLVPDLTFTKYVKLMRLHCQDNETVTDVEVYFDAGEQEEQEA